MIGILNAPWRYSHGRDNIGKAAKRQTPEPAAVYERHAAKRTELSRRHTSEAEATLKQPGQQSGGNRAVMIRFCRRLCWRLQCLAAGCWRAQTAVTGT